MQPAKFPKLRSNDQKPMSNFNDRNFFDETAREFFEQICELQLPFQGYLSPCKRYAVADTMPNIGGEATVVLPNIGGGRSHPPRPSSVRH